MAIHTFDSFVQKANLWIKELMNELDFDEQMAYHALKGILVELRNKLELDEIAELSAQLPIIIRGIYFDGWNPSSKPIKYSKSEFVSRVHAHMQNNPEIDPTEIVQKTFIFLSKKISEGEVNDIKSNLPKKIKELWKK
ncbi:MAG: DUF2267 domain-containing protein [Nanoarchaeota archaeon]